MKISAILLFLLLLALFLLGPDTPAQSPQEAEAPLETFVPTEKLPADSAISFPVDI